MYEPEASVAILEPGPLRSINGCEPQLAPVAINFRLIATVLPDPKMSSGSMTELGVAVVNGEVLVKST